MFYCFVMGPTVVNHVDISGEAKYINKIIGDVQVKQCVFIHNFRKMLW